MILPHRQNLFTTELNWVVMMLCSFKCLEIVAQHLFEIEYFSYIIVKASIRLSLVFSFEMLKATL